MGGGGGGGGSRIGTVCRGRNGVVLCVRQRSRVRLDPSSPVRRCTNRRWSNCGPNLSTQVGTRERASCLQTMAPSTLVAAFALSAFARRLLQRNTCRISALAMRNSGHTRLVLGLVVLLHVERTV